MVRADRDVLTSARTLLEAMVAVVLAANAIELAALLGAVIGARDADAAGPDTRARLDALERALAELDPASWSIERALIGESIRARRAAETLAVGRRAQLGLARGVRALDVYHEAAIAYARDPERTAPPAELDPDDFSVILEPYAPLVVQAVIDVVPLIDRYRRTADRSAERSEVARVALAAARARAAPAAAARE